MTERLRISPSTANILACPKTKQPLRIREVADGETWLSITRKGSAATHLPASKAMLCTEDGRFCYPLAEGFPVLLWPEVFTAAGVDAEADLKHHNYAEAYAEMEHYNPTSLDRADKVKSSDAYARLQTLVTEKPPQSQFPQPLHQWLDALHDTAAQADAYSYLAPLTGKVFVQLGGDGRHAVKSVLAGARQGILITPMLGEAVFAMRLAEEFDVADRVSCILGVGEEIPLRDSSVDAVYSPGCLHHMTLDSALPELRRVLSKGGRFCGHEPWQAPLYTFGTWLFGKRERGLFDRSKSIFCRPFNDERLAPLPRHFPQHVINNHGPLLRYPLIALQKFGIRFPLRRMVGLAQFDDRAGRALGISPRFGGSIMIGGENS